MAAKITSKATAAAMGVGGKLFAGNRGFDPINIIMQIVSLEFLYYTSLSLMILFFDFIVGYRSHMGQLFSPSSFDLTLDYSYTTVLANFANIVLVVTALAYVVEKANRCFDFCLTIFFLHLILTWSIYKFPVTLTWWATHAALITITVLASEYVCLRLETAEIKLSLGHMITRGKELGVKGANKLMKVKRKTSKDMAKLKKKDKTDDA